MIFSDSTKQNLSRVALRLPPVPHELRLVPVVGLEQGGADGLRQARVIETDAEIVLRAVAAGPRRPGVADARLADEHPEHRRVLVVAVVVRDQPHLRVDRQRVDGTGPAAILGGRECADHGPGLTSPGLWLTGARMDSGAPGGAAPSRQALQADRTSVVS